MKSSVLAGGMLAAIFLIAPVLAQQENAQTGENDDPAKVEGMSPEESEQQLEATSDPIDQARVETREEEAFGSYLTNQDGKSLYIFTQDEQGGDYSTCDESCAIAWPPYTTEEPPAGGEQVDEERLGVIEREDGTQQVTYNGWPLYYFARDVYPGDALGQGLEHMGGHWYLLSPEGKTIEEASPKQAEPTDT
ncbi:COG4315 family predicted lipoprotein [Billgrantia sp. C5P2]|uniref:COG4315 family predicted lipoprotein n=1 Tax=Billgrantia sp. C5P2 TaxID=3436239 RepID=UPI003DA2B9FB